jgi:hypothetical protein
MEVACAENIFSLCGCLLPGGHNPDTGHLNSLSKGEFIVPMRNDRGQVRAVDLVWSTGSWETLRFGYSLSPKGSHVRILVARMHGGGGTFQRLGLVEEN